MRKRYERAAVLLSKANASRPAHLPSMQSLGQALFRLNRYNDAIDLLRRVAEADPDDKETLFYLGQAHYELGQQDHAGKIFKRLRGDPRFGPRASLIAGSIHLKNRSYEEAEMDFQLGLKHEEIPPEILLELKYRLAATYFRKQEIDKAVKALGDIMRINPSYKDVGEQIDRARELASNRNLQTFLISPASEFVGLARRIVTNYVPDSRVKIVDIAVSGSESADVLAEIRSPKWEDTALFRLIRTTGQVGELVVRDLQSRVKDLHAGRGFCISAGTYSEGAQTFVEARFIDLVEKEGLVKILRRLSSPA
jgi:tetratricopeptide (TPR) repeat protein